MLKIIFIAISLYSLTACKLKRDENFRSVISTLPLFKFKPINNTTVFSAKEILPGRPIIIIYFKTDCIHCQAEIKNLTENIDSFKNVQIYLLSSMPLGDLRNFYTNFKLNRFKNIIVGEDYDYSFYQMYKPSAVPFIAIYNKQKKLVAIYVEAAKIQSLIEATRVL